MARFDAYPNPDLADRPSVPFLLDIQNDYIKGLQTRVMVPLWNMDALSLAAADLNPVFEVAGLRVVMDTAAMGAVPLGALKGSIDNLGRHQLAIQSALDMFFGG